jgi:curved DNA-binding protein CbpA
MKTPYDILGVNRNASDETIRASFRKTAKACHPDLNAGDRTAEQQLRLAIAAYQILKSPQRRAAYDQYLRKCRRERAQRFAVDGVAALVSGSVVSLAIWMSVSLSNTQEAPGPTQTPSVAAVMASEAVNHQVAAADDISVPQDDDGGRKIDLAAAAPNRRLPGDSPQHLQQSASSSIPPTAGSPEPRALLAKKWEQVQASDDPKAIWAFAVRNPDAPESALARSKLVALIDAAEDVSLLHVLRLVATDAIAERAQQRLVHLGALARDPEKWEPVFGKDHAQNKDLERDGDSKKSHHALTRDPEKSLPSDLIQGSDPAFGKDHPQTSDVEQDGDSNKSDPALAVAKEDSVAPDAASSNSPSQASVSETIKPANRKQPAAQKAAGRGRIVVKRQVANRAAVREASTENRNTSACLGFQPCVGSVAPLFGVGF